MAVTEAQRTQIMSLSGDTRRAFLGDLNNKIIAFNGRITRLSGAGGVSPTVVQAWRAYMARWVAWAGQGADSNTQLLAFFADFNDWGARLAATQQPSSDRPPAAPEPFPFAWVLGVTGAVVVLSLVGLYATSGRT